MYKNFSELGDSKSTPNNNQYRVTDVTTAEEKQQILNTHQIVLVNIHADWCKPCKQMAPLYSQLASKYNKPGVCAVIRENIDKNLTKNISSVPTMQFYRNNTLVGNVVGADIMQTEEILQKLLGEQSQEHKPLAFQSNTIRKHSSMHKSHQNGVTEQPQPYQPSGNYHMPNVTFHN